MKAPKLFLYSLPLSLSFPLIAAAEEWQLDPAVALRAAEVYLSTRNPADQYGSTVKSLQGSIGIRRSTAASIWDSSIALDAAEANQASYAENNLQSRLTLRDKTSSMHINLGYRHTHGFDPIQQPIEEAAVKDARSFDSLYLGLYHQIAINPLNDVAFYVGGGRNSEGEQKAESKDAQLSWDIHHSMAWTSRLRVRTTDSENKLTELMQEQIYRFDEKLSVELSYGYGWQSSPVDRTQGLLGGLTFQYRTSGMLTSASAYEGLAPAREISAEETESLRGSSLYRLGWTHSRDQRRIGDPFYYADIVYGLARIDLVAKQGLELKASLSRASEQRLFNELDDYKSELMEGAYEWGHHFLLRFPDAKLRLSYSAETTELPPRRYFREIYQLQYRLIW